ncbi:MAG: hypothetical protein RL275_144 [Chloroflexota bacterium]|jgi:hypothetical protein
MMKGYEKGGMADKMGRAVKRKTKDATGRAMPKMPPMPTGMKKGGKAMKKGK